MFTYHYDSPLGGITIVSDGTAVTGLWFDDQKNFADTLKDAQAVTDTRKYKIFGLVKKWLDVYFSGKVPDFTPPLKISGSNFRHVLCDILLKIPYGKTMTYSEIADIITKRSGGGKFSARTVGGTVSRNSILLIIPCHRVIGKDGSLKGYSGGVDRKEKLLKLEGISVTKN